MSLCPTINSWLGRDTPGHADVFLKAQGIAHPLLSTLIIWGFYCSIFLLFGDVCTTDSALFFLR